MDRQKNPKRQEVRRARLVAAALRSGHFRAANRAARHGKGNQ